AADRLAGTLRDHRDRVAKLADEMLPVFDKVRPIVDELADQDIAVRRAEAEYLTATKRREVAEIELREYTEGTYPLELRAIEGELTLGHAEQTRADDRLSQAKAMLDKGSISPTQVLAARQDAEKAKIGLEQAREKAKVLKQYTAPKIITERKAAIE